MLIRGNLGLLPALPVAGSGMDRDHLRGILLQHIRLNITHPGAGALPGIPPHGSAEVFLPVMTAISWAWFSGALFESRILRPNDRFRYRTPRARRS